MFGAIPLLPYMISWCVQEQLCLYLLVMSIRAWKMGELGSMSVGSSYPTLNHIDQVDSVVHPASQPNCTAGKAAGGMKLTVHLY